MVAQDIAVINCLSPSLDIIWTLCTCRASHWNGKQAL